jgi:calcineurin-like phosphoesterase family protein
MIDSYFIGQPRFFADPQQIFTRTTIWDKTEEMNDDLVKYWNSEVGKYDNVFVLGELFGGPNRDLSFVEELNGHIHFIHNQKDVEHKYTNTEWFTTFCSMEFLADPNSIYLTNYLEHINTVESNIIISSNDNTTLLKRVNYDYCYFVNHCGTTRLIKNLHSPVFNVCADDWEFKPVSIRKILDLYNNYRRTYTD